MPTQKENLKEQRIAYLCLQATCEGQASHAHVHEIVRGLRARGWQVDVFEPAYANRTQAVSLIRKCWAFFIVQLRLWIRLRTYSVLYVRAHPAAFPTSILARCLGCQVVQEVNGPFDEVFVVFRWTRILRPILSPTMLLPIRLASAVVVVTDGLKEWLCARTRVAPTYVIPNAANIELFYPSAPKLPDLPDDYVLFFGALATWQSVEEILAAVDSSHWPKEVHLVIAGDGALRPLVEEVAGSNPGVTYLGRVPYRKMANLVANSIGGLCPKNNSAGHLATGLAPLKVYETLACGVPVVVTDIPGQADIVRGNDCGVVIPDSRPDTIARAVAVLWEDPEGRREMGNRGRKVVVREHSWDSRAADTDRVIRDCQRRAAA